MRAYATLRARLRVCAGPAAARRAPLPRRPMLMTAIGPHASRASGAPFSFSSSFWPRCTTPGAHGTWPPPAKAAWCASTARHTISANSDCASRSGARRRSGQAQARRRSARGVAPSEPPGRECWKCRPRTYDVLAASACRHRMLSHAARGATHLDARGVAGVHEAHRRAAHQQAVDVGQRGERLAVVAADAAAVQDGNRRRHGGRHVLAHPAAQRLVHLRKATARAEAAQRHRTKHSCGGRHRGRAGSVGMGGATNSGARGAATLARGWRHCRDDGWNERRVSRRLHADGAMTRTS